MLLAHALLALACAAPLLANPASNYNGLQCADKMIGVKTGFSHRLNAVTTPVGAQTSRIDIPNNCERDRMLLRGEQVTVCDVVPPLVQSDLFTPILVTRRGGLGTPAYIYVVQYCST